MGRRLLELQPRGQRPRQCGSWRKRSRERQRQGLVRPVGGPAGPDLAGRAGRRAAQIQGGGGADRPGRGRPAGRSRRSSVALDEGMRRQLPVIPVLLPGGSRPASRTVLSCASSAGSNSRAGWTTRRPWATCFGASPAAGPRSSTPERARTGSRWRARPKSRPRRRIPPPRRSGPLCVHSKSTNLTLVLGRELPRRPAAADRRPAEPRPAGARST